jgi:DNA-repair protein complementing XP-A cells
LRDESLPHLLRANPHKSSWSDMKLFLRCQVEKFAIRKWGSLSNIEVESESRKRLKNEKKEKRFKKKLSELRRTTRTDEWQKQHNLASAASLHQHEFEATSKMGVKKCKSCDLVIEEEEL